MSTWIYEDTPDPVLSDCGVSQLPNGFILDTPDGGDHGDNGEPGTPGYMGESVVFESKARALRWLDAARAVVEAQPDPEGRAA